MLSLYDQTLQEFAEYEAAYPMAYPWNDTIREDVPRYRKDTDGWWVNPEASGNGKALVCCVGDLICEGRLTRAHRYGDSVFFHPLFQYVRPILRQADLAIGNLETTVSDFTPDAGKFHTVAGKYHCNTTESFLDALRYAGFDGVVNANNHNCDSGAAGLAETNQRLDQHGFFHTGTFLPGEDERAALVNINGIRAGILSYATFFNRLEGNFTELGQKMLNPFSPEQAKKDVTWARAQGAEFILCYIHWGKEYQHYPTDLQKEQAQALADAGVDYIVGSHSHCLQISDTVKAADGRTVPLVYSMGNFITNEAKDLCRHSGILQLLLQKTDQGIRVTNYFVPCYIFDAFQTSRYSPVPADPLYNGGFVHPELSRTRKFSVELIPLGEPASGRITIQELCKLLEIPMQPAGEQAAISGICTNPEHVLERQLYFSAGDESEYATKSLWRRRPIWKVTQTPSQEEQCLVVQDVKAAYHRVITHLRSRFACRFLTVAGAEDKTATAELIREVLQKAYRVHFDTADHGWMHLHPSHEWCVQELRSGPFGYQALAPSICVITSYVPDLAQLLSSLCAHTQILYNGEDADLAAALEHIGNAQAFFPVDFPGLRMEVAAGAAHVVAKQLGLPMPERWCYRGMEQNIYRLDGVTVLTDYACKSLKSAKRSLSALTAYPGKTIAVVEEKYVSAARADVVIPVAEPSTDRQERMRAELLLEQQLLTQLVPGCTVLLCGCRNLALNLTLRRVFGLTDGAIFDVT